MIKFNDSAFVNAAAHVPSAPMPARSGDIPVVSIEHQLEELDSPRDSLSLGMYDMIGEYTAKKQRGPDSENFHKYGAFFRPNYERGMLIAALIKKHHINTYLELGFGRGYSCMCAAMAMHEAGIAGKIVTVDPNFNNEHIKNLSNIFPQEWLALIELQNKTSDAYFANTTDNFEMIYIDGDHRYDAVLRDWHNSKERATKFILFDDYHMPGKNQKDMDVSNVVDSISGYDKKLIKMDRRIFFDDRLVTYDELDYGQVLITKDEK